MKLLDIIIKIFKCDTFDNDSPVENSNHNRYFKSKNHYFVYSNITKDWTYLKYKNKLVEKRYDNLSSEGLRNILMKSPKMRNYKISLLLE